MRDKHYDTKSFRLSKKVFEKLKKEKPKELSWNLFFKKLIEKYNVRTK